MTNQLFRDYLDGKIIARRRIRPGVYFLPVGSYDPAVPTMLDLEQGVDLSIVTIGYTTDIEAAAREEERQAQQRALAQAAAFTGESIEDLGKAMAKIGAAADKEWVPRYVMPPPPYPVGNIATPKRRRRL